jgi:hypothetical protein
MAETAKEQAEARRQQRLQFNGLMKLAQIGLTRWTTRRQHEWKITVSIWAALLAALVTDKSKDIPPIILAVVILIHALWIRQNYLNNTRDLRDAFGYIAKAHKSLLGYDRPTFVEPRIRKWLIERHPVIYDAIGFLTDGICLSATLITITLSLGVWYHLGTR